jgi:cyclohexadienyl dehydratase
MQRGHILVGMSGDYKPFTYSEKGYLMPRDAVFKMWVDQWLHTAMNDGTYRRIYDKWLK